MSLRVLTNMKPKVSHMRNTKAKIDASTTLLMAGRSDVNAGASKQASIGY
jgi:hypothetical protein